MVRRQPDACGLSTCLLVEQGCQHTAVEHDADFVQQLRQFDLQAADTVIVAPLDGTPPWYRWQPEQTFDVILVDGPNTIGTVVVSSSPDTSVERSLSGHPVAERRSMVAGRLGARSQCGPTPLRRGASDEWIAARRHATTRGANVAPRQTIVLSMDPGYQCPGYHHAVATRPKRDFRRAGDCYGQLSQLLVIPLHPTRPIAETTADRCCRSRWMRAPIDALATTSNQPRQ